MKIAILDDYQNVALKMADWSALAARADITVFNDHLADPEAVVERLAPFEIVCVMRERTPLPREILQRLPRLKLIASTGARNASIDVIDTGTGIPVDKLETIFEPFVQLGRSLSSAHQGMGLGLAISRDLARAMSGDLTVISRVGVGSTFTLTLPRAE